MYGSWARVTSVCPLCNWHSSSATRISFPLVLCFTAMQHKTSFIAALCFSVCRLEGGRLLSQCLPYTSILLNMCAKKIFCYVCGRGQYSIGHLHRNIELPNDLPSFILNNLLVLIQFWWILKRHKSEVWWIHESVTRYFHPRSPMFSKYSNLGLLLHL